MHTRDISYQSLTEDPHRSIPGVCCALVFALLCVLYSGCRSQAQQDVYTDKMASRIRVLEDELNHADYELMVLRQKLERAEKRGSSMGSSRSGLSSPDRSTVPNRERSSAGSPENYGNGDNLDNEDAEVPSLSTESPYDLDIDLGTPVDEIDAPEMSIGEPLTPEGPAVDPDTLPPLQPLPPRSEDIEPPQIDPGMPAPPDLQNSIEELPPGQVITPDSAKLLLPPLPTTLTLHPGLSGTHHDDSDDEVDGMYLVLTLYDQNGQPMRADQPLSIVLLDPARESADARLGRWDFTAEQVSKAFRQSPLPSIQLPVLWQDRRPQGQQVAVFARIPIAAEQYLQTDIMLEMEAPHPSDWQARGLGTPERPARSTQFDTNEVWR